MLSGNTKSLRFMRQAVLERERYVHAEKVRNKDNNNGETKKRSLMGTDLNGTQENAGKVSSVGALSLPVKQVCYPGRRSFQGFNKVIEDLAQTRIKPIRTSESLKRKQAFASLSGWFGIFWMVARGDC